MTAALLYIFAFSTWGLGILTWLVLLGLRIRQSNQDTELNKINVQLIALKLQENRVKLADEMISQVRQRMGGQVLSSPLVPGGSEISTKLQELIKTAGSHPEVKEIDNNDLIIGVRFEGEDYPPTVDDDDDDEDS